MKIIAGPLLLPQGVSIVNDEPFFNVDVEILFDAKDQVAADPFLTANDADGPLASVASRRVDSTFSWTALAYKLPLPLRATAYDATATVAGVSATIHVPPAGSSFDRFVAFAGAAEEPVKAACELARARHIPIGICLGGLVDCLDIFTLPPVVEWLAAGDAAAPLSGPARAAVDAFIFDKFVQAVGTPHVHAIFSTLPMLVTMDDDDALSTFPSLRDSALGAAINKLHRRYFFLFFQHAVQDEAATVGFAHDAQLLRFGDTTVVCVDAFSKNSTACLCEDTAQLEVVSSAVASDAASVVVVSNVPLISSARMLPTALRAPHAALVPVLNGLKIDHAECIPNREWSLDASFALRTAADAAATRGAKVSVISSFTRIGEVWDFPSLRQINAIHTMGGSSRPGMAIAKVGAVDVLDGVRRAVLKKGDKSKRFVCRGGFVVIDGSAVEFVDGDVRIGCEGGAAAPPKGPAADVGENAQASPSEAKGGHDGPTAAASADVKAEASNEAKGSDGNPQPAQAVHAVAVAAKVQPAPEAASPKASEAKAVERSVRPVSCAVLLTLTGVIERQEVKVLFNTLK